MVFTTEPGIDPDQSTYVDPFTVDGRLIACDPDGTWTSRDGSTWTRIAGTAADGAVDITIADGGLIAVGADEDRTAAAVWIAHPTR